MSGLALFLLLVSPILLFFFIYQISLILSGMTTNEVEKWSNLHAAIDDKVLFAVYPAGSKQQDFESLVGKLEVIEIDDQELDTRPKLLITDRKFLKNSYDFGPWNNLKLIF
ncbi:Palmitoyltransferase swf1 [Smittium culicis]|uniref:Palmitoyltransferase swf1 n=1 Tax=Smittium culicis TaxID=133412 RepID=A0A1R1X007_9FUNG|nr:Palmitoyltransferase swf1 [Smittium culicis]OMJ22689.1 Palmitoyltransferase swf1 [Smittium culicis]